MNETKSTLLTVKQVAERLQFSISTVYSLAASGDIPSYKLGGSIRFKEKEIEDWIEDGKKQPEDVDDKVRKLLHRDKPLDINGIIRREIDSAKRS